MGNFVYCFDEDLANKLSLTLKLLKQEMMDGKNCWIFVGDNNKLQFNELDKSKIIISNRLNF
ncbi:hypothetical protein [Methanoculleus sp.]|uniref:hypothetical protein n=1 Tax=Methanoculleus sp. TaxID=90427 RepID=UPI0025D9710A|nr:hypothetical protein [Methanoculleus sp.]MCK9319245.1 hypothetical protein [Methanoculleus sp.]